MDLPGGLIHNSRDPATGRPAGRNGVEALRRMGELSNTPGLRRLRRLAVAIAVCAAAVLLGAAKAHAGDAPSVSMHLSTDTADPNTPVTFTATVTATTGFPAGTIKFATVTDPADGIEDTNGVSTFPVQTTSPSTPFTGTASMTAKLKNGTYQIVAYFSPADQSLTFLPANSIASPQTLTITSVIQYVTTTTLTVTPGTLPITAGDHEALTANVTTDGGPVPDDGIVTFTDGGQTIGQANVVNGVATLLDAKSFGPGDHSLAASYGGSGAFSPSSTLQPFAFHVADDSPQPTATTTTLTLSRYVIHQGETIDMTAHVEQKGGALAPAGGEVYFYSDPYCQNGVLGSAPLDASGNATITNIGNWTAQAYTLCASYLGDTFRLGSGDTKPLTVLAAGATTVPTTVTYTGATSGDYGDQVELAAHVSAGGSGVAGPVTFTVGNQTCPATAGADGNATCVLTLKQKAGSYSVATHYAGDAGLYLPGDANAAAFTITTEESALALTAPATVTAGQTLHLTASLAGDGTDRVSGATISFTSGSTTLCTAKTASDGTATCDVTATGRGPASFSAAFAGDGYYTGASGTAATLVQLTTTIVYTGPSSADYGDPAVLKAHFATQDGTMPTGPSVTFTLGSQHCSAPVDASTGDATCTIARITDPTATSVAVHYGGSSDQIYLPSDGGASFGVTPEETTLSLNVAAAALTGSTVTVQATLLEDGTTPADGSHAVTIGYGGQTCTVLTVAGIATCSFTAGSPGPVSIGATFGGDSAYATSNAISQTLYVYAPTPGGGMFVVGDKTATGSVTFWGNQWWKQNGLSLGVAPSSFKGYALHGSTACGAQWSTDPGNSSPPPAGPLPSYIAVIVASSASKTGAAISGGTLHVVVVKTASYDSNPGHPGTGTVVAPVC